MKLGALKMAPGFVFCHEGHEGIEGEIFMNFMVINNRAA